MNERRLSIITGISYLIIFFSAIFANFLMLETIKASPIEAIQNHDMMVRFGILAFMVTVVFDVVVAWSLNELYKDNPFTKLSTYFRIIHATIMGVAIFALVMSLGLNDGTEILHQVDVFNTIWLIGLFFFGFHLILLGSIIIKPKLIALFLIIAGVMYIIDTSAQFLIKDYQSYASIFLALVAIPSIVGEMSFAIWLLVKGGKSINSFE